MGSSTSGHRGIASQMALKEWKDETGGIVAQGVARTIERIYRNIVHEYQTIQSKPYNTSSDAQFLFQVSPFDGAVKLVSERVMGCSRLNMPLDCVQYIVRALAAKQTGGATLPYRIQLSESY